VYEFQWYAEDIKTQYIGNTHGNPRHLVEDIYQEDRGEILLWTCRLKASDEETSSVPGTDEATIKP
jgi:hypothetical protein